MAVASAQLAWESWRRSRLWRGLTVALALAVVAGLLLWDASLPARFVDSASRVIQGDKGAGLRARFSEQGNLAGNLAYLREHPFSPIGLTYGSQRLFYGDSGIVLVLLRGSLPLFLMTYFGFAYLLVRNLRLRGDALWLFAVTFAFEIGYTPLQSFRFTAFLPFAMVYLNDLPNEDQPRPQGQDSGSGAAVR
jgi:hypothetical protein